MEQPAWHGDWMERIRERVRSKGFTSLLDFTETRPTATFLDLANDLGVEDVAAVQIEWLLKDEALKRNCFERFARATLVREIYDELPQGWGVGEKADFRGAGVYAGWGRIVGPEYDEATDRVWDALKRLGPPVGWLPAHADDPLVVKAFQEGDFEKALEAAAKNTEGRQ